jgi:hypothetical protein
MHPAEIAIIGTLFGMTQKLTGTSLPADSTPEGFKNGRCGKLYLSCYERNILRDDIRDDSARVHEANFVNRIAIT